MTDFAKVPNSWDITQYLENTAWFVAHDLLCAETATDIAENIIVSRVETAHDAVAEANYQEDQKKLDAKGPSSIEDVADILKTRLAEVGIQADIHFSSATD